MSRADRTNVGWVLMCAAIVDGCAEETMDVEALAIGKPPPTITKDSCTPQTGTFSSCAAALAATGQSSGCFSIRPPFASTAVPRMCTKKKVLVMQLDNDLVPPDGLAPDAAYLDEVLDGLVAFIDASTYGRVVFDIEVAGVEPNPADRWFVATDKPRHANEITLLNLGCNGESAATTLPIHEYDIITTLATASGRSYNTGCDINVDTACDGGYTPPTTFHKTCTVIFKYRQAKFDAAEALTVTAHETGHALGLGHDHAYSSLSGRGPTRVALHGRFRNYGGRSSIMGAGTFASFNLPERISAGWLNDGILGAGPHMIAVADAGGLPVSSTLTFDTLEPNVEGKKGVFIPTDAGHYWIEARRDPELEPTLQTGLIIHHGATDDDEGLMLDGTPETASPTMQDGALPLGRTYADPDSHIYITALSETTTTATVEVQRDPVNPHAPVISAVEVEDCSRALPRPCVGAPPTAPGSSVKTWRFNVTASDVDGDPLSYSWRFGVGANERISSGDLASGASVLRTMATSLPPMRAFVTVSDRKGGEVTSWVDWPSRVSYRAAWDPPAILDPTTDCTTVAFQPSHKLALEPLELKKWEADNEFALGACTSGTELLDYAWTVGNADSPWSQPVVDGGAFAAANASAPPCVPVTLQVTDTSNCVAEPTRCQAVVEECLHIPIRLSYMPKIGSPIAFSLALYVDTAALFPAGATLTYTWDADCPLTVGSTQLTAEMSSPGCKVTASVTDGDKEYAATVIPH